MEEVVKSPKNLKQPNQSLLENQSRIPKTLTKTFNKWGK